MKSKTQKSLFILFSIFTFLFISLLLFPLVFKKQILEIANKEINKSLKAEVKFRKLNINFIRSFPNASISLKDIYIIGKDEFKGDTLLNSKEFQLVVNVKSLFANAGYKIKKIKISDTRLFAHVLKDGTANWDIVKSTPTVEKDTTSSDLSLRLENFQIENSDVLFLQDDGNVFTELKKINLNLSGDFTTNTTSLRTKLEVDTIRLSNNNVEILPFLKLMFEAEIKTNLEKQRYELAENKIKINEIPFSLNGWVELKDSLTRVDMKLKTGQIEFKSLLSLIPAIYSKSFDEIEAGGDINLEGSLRGDLVGENYPDFDLKLDIDKGWFKYPDLPKSVEAIQVQSHIFSKGGFLDNTVVDVANFSFNMGGNPFQASLNVTTPISDPNIELKADGKLNLGMIKEIYPLDKNLVLSGLLSVDVAGRGRMSYLNNMERLRFSGSANIRDFMIKVNQSQRELRIDNARLFFSNYFLYLTQMNVKIGANDIKGEGRVENFLAYALKDKMLKGRFKITSNLMNLNDFITENQLGKDEEEKKETDSTFSVVEIPQNLDLILTSNFKELRYKKMTFNNGYAKFVVSKGNLDIQKMYVDAFGGKMNLSGQYSSQEKTKPYAKLNVDLYQISFNPIIEQVDFLQKVVPFFQNATGKFNANLSLNTVLNQDMTPKLNSIISQGHFNTYSVQIKETSFINEFIQKVGLTNVEKYTKLRNISIAFNIENGKLITQPFTLKMGDYDMKLNGYTGLDKTIDYQGKIKLPHKFKFEYFKEVPFKIGGTFTKPTINVDMSKVVIGFIKKEKRKVIDKIERIKESKIEKIELEKDKIIKEARQRADKILIDAKRRGDIIIQKARATGDSIVDNTKNPIAKMVTKRAAKKLVEQAEKKADKIYKKAQKESQKEIDKINKQTKIKK